MVFEVLTLHRWIFLVSIYRWVPILVMSLLENVTGAMRFYLNFISFLTVDCNVKKKKFYWLTLSVQHAAYINEFYWKFNWWKEVVHRKTHKEFIFFGAVCLPIRCLIVLLARPCLSVKKSLATFNLYFIVRIYLFEKMINQVYKLWPLLIDTKNILQVPRIVIFRIMD